MVKKQVPDWLNSSLWSTTPSTPPPPPRDDAPSSSDHSPVDRKPAVPAIKPPEPVKVEVKDPLRDSVVSDHQDENNYATTSPSSSSIEDVSKQAQLLQEVVLTLSLYI